MGYMGRRPDSSSPNLTHSTSGRHRCTRVKHQATAETALELCLIRVRLAVAVVAKADEKVAECWIGKPRKIGERGRAVSVIRGARCQAVADSVAVAVLTCSPRIIAGR